MATSSACSCFGNLRKRYKRLVDKIFPEDPQQGLVKSNMDKLTFYALSAPEKLDRIGDYMYSKMNNFLYRKKLNYVQLAIEAMDHILLACRSSSLNLFVESFLRMVNTVLECSEPDLKVAATNSFIKFANIDEDTPSYHRRYDFFVSRFSEMCWDENKDRTMRSQIRVSGLRGLHGVVRKTSKDDLQVNIWDDIHMAKIVPSLLFNMEQGGYTLRRKSSANVAMLQSSSSYEINNEDPGYMAESCFRDMVSRASFGNIGSVISPMLEYIDCKGLWVPNDFAVFAFKVVIYAIQNQYSYKAIEILLHHLDSHSKSKAQVKASIIEVICSSASVTTGGSIGPSVLEVFNTLLRHMTLSADHMLSLDNEDKESRYDESEENLVQEAVIKTMGTFSSTFPDYQKIEVMSFVAAKIPKLIQQRRASMAIMRNEGPTETDIYLQKQLFRALLKMAESHRNASFTTTFPSSLLEPTLRGIVQTDPDVRFNALCMFEALLDRHKNTEKLIELSSLDQKEGQAGLLIEKCSKQDLAFMRKSAQQLFFHLYNSAQASSNTGKHFSVLTNVLCLLLLELGEEEAIVELVQFALGIQNLAASSNSGLSFEQATCLHALVAKFFFLLAYLTTIPDLKNHCDEIIKRRKQSQPTMLPESAFVEGGKIEQRRSRVFSDEFLFDLGIVINALKASGYDTSGVESSYEPQGGPPRAASTASLPEAFPTHHLLKGSVSTTSIADTSNDLNITYNHLRSVVQNREQKEQKKTLNFEKATFDEIVAYSDQINLEKQRKLNSILESVTHSTAGPKIEGLGDDIFSIKYPEMFVL